MNSKKKLILLLIPVVLLLSGCGQVSTEYTGVWNFLVIALAKAIVFFSDILGDSLGLGIITMTILVRVVMIPLYGSQIKSSEATKALQPKINKLNEKYSNKKDQENQRKKSLEQQALYKEAGVNPLAGCLPIFIQLPILIAFYQAIEYLVPPQAIINQMQEQGQTLILGLEQLAYLRWKSCQRPLKLLQPDFSPPEETFRQPPPQPTIKPPKQ